MSKHSRHRRRKRLAGAVVACAATVPSYVQGSPFVNVFVSGRDVTRGDASFVSDLGLSPRPVQSGDTIQFQLFVKMASIGTTNSTFPASTITSLTSAGGVDGVNSLTFDIFQLNSDSAQGDFKITKPRVFTSLHYATTPA